MSCSISVHNLVESLFDGRLSLCIAFVFIGVVREIGIAKSNGLNVSSKIELEVTKRRDSSFRYINAGTACTKQPLMLNLITMANSCWLVLSLREKGLLRAFHSCFTPVRGWWPTVTS